MDGATIPRAQKKRQTQGCWRASSIDARSRARTLAGAREQVVRWLRLGVEKRHRIPEAATAPDFRIWDDDAEIRSLPLSSQRRV